MSTGLHREQSRISFGTEKVRDIPEWKHQPKSWTHYPERKLTTSAESHLLYHYGRTLGSGRYADVGAYRGASAAAIGHGLHDAGQYGRVYAVDLYGDTCDSRRCCPNADIPEKLAEYFKESFPRVELDVCKGDSAAWGRALDASFRFVFIDADHTYEGCKRDVEAWARLVEPGGVLAFHDTDFDSVDQVIRELPRCFKLERHVFTTKAFRRV